MPMSVYQLLAESGAQTRLDVVPPRGLTPLVGREQEVGLLLERWAESPEGHGQVVLLSGEAGIGKSRLVEVLRERIGREQTMWLDVSLFPLPYEQRAVSGDRPISNGCYNFARRRPRQRGSTGWSTPCGRLRLPLEETVPLVAALLSVPWRSATRRWTGVRKSSKQKTYEALVVWLMAEAEHQPVLVVWEDLHWADPSTLEWLGLVLDQSAHRPAVCTC